MFEQFICFADTHTHTPTYISHVADAVGAFEENSVVALLPPPKTFFC